jgi:ribosomal protein L37AE/L43A
VVWYRALARLLSATPVCPGCGESTRAVGEDVIHDLPSVLESRYECPRCDREVVRRDVVDVWT